MVGEGVIVGCGGSVATTMGVMEGVAFVGIDVNVEVGGTTMMSGDATGMQAAIIKVRERMNSILYLSTFLLGK